jgi:hypothetical protein
LGEEYITVNYDIRINAIIRLVMVRCGQAGQKYILKSDAVILVVEQI